MERLMIPESYPEKNLTSRSKETSKPACAPKSSITIPRGHLSNSRNSPRSRSPALSDMIERRNIEIITNHASLLNSKGMGRGENALETS